ncbi:MAG: class I SAM-dependent methyltransferase [Anaerolineales bacterium]
MHDEHYMGLVAEWYDEWLKERTGDINYYSDFFHDFDGRILELACGTGRLLIPIAQSGIQIDGLDSSKDMLVILKEKAARLGLKDIGLYNQSMEEFTISTKYDAIFAGGGAIQLLVSPESAMNSLKCIRKHLSAKGFFLADIFIPWENIYQRKCDDYHVTRDRTHPDGRRSIVLERFEIDISEQLKRGTYRYEFYEQKRLVECITDDLSIRWYWKDEFLNLLREAGFSNIEILTQSSLYYEGYAFVFKAM